MERDERVILFGEDVAEAGGVFKVTEGIVDRIGTHRVARHPDLRARASPARRSAPPSAAAAR